MPILGAKGGASEISYRGELDDIPEIFTFTNLIGVEPGVTYTSEVATLTGLNYRAKVSIVGSGSSFSINGGNYISTTAFVENGDTIRLAITPQKTPNPVDFDRNTTATVRVGRFSSPWNIRTRTIDGTPDPFAFPTVSNAAITTTILSFPVTLVGIETNTFTTASVLSDTGLMQINGAVGVRTANVFSGDELILIRPALTDTPSSYVNPVNVTVVVGGFSTTWTINPVAADTTPNSFSFVGVSSAGIGSVFTSNSITVSGINSTAIPAFTVPISIGSTTASNFSYNVNGGVYQNTTGTVKNGDTVSLRVVTPSTYSTGITGILTIGGISTSWALTTRTQPINTIPNAFVFNDIGNNEALNTVLTSNSITLTGISSGQNAIAFIANGAGTFRVTRNNVVVRDYSAASILVQNNDVINLRLTSPVNYGQSASTAFTVSGVDFNDNLGSVSDTWTITNFPSPDAPVVKFSVGADPNAEILSSTINLGSSATLSWSVTGQISGAITSVSINQGIGTVANSGSITVTPTTTTAYTLTATGPGGTVNQTITVIIPPAPVINTFTASPTPIPIGSNSTLSWNISNIVTSVSINQGVGVVTTSGSASVSPTTNTSYTITAVGPGGTRTGITTVQVIPLPTSTFSATPINITTGNSSTLSWNSTNASSASIDQGIGGVSTTGTRLVTPTTTTTYSLTASNISGVSTSTTTVNVFPLPTINNFTVSPSTVNQGNSATLSWNISGAVSITINNGIGAVNATGSRNVNPSSTTTYVLTATNAAGGVRTATAILNVNQIPTATFNASPTSIFTGQSSTLSWNTTNASSVSISPNVGSVNANGSRTVSPGTTTTYTLTATGSGGSITRTAQVTVTCSESSDTTTSRYGSGVCGTCSGGCVGTYWKGTDGGYYGNANRMGGRVSFVNSIFFAATNRFVRSTEIDNEVNIYTSLGEDNSAYLSNVQSRFSLVVPSPVSICGNSFTSLTPTITCSG
jgi:hypothetical protein